MLHPDFPISSAMPIKNASTPIESSSGSLGSQIVKVSDIAISFHYRFVSPIYSDSMTTPLKLFPIEIGIGMLSLCSKSAVMDGIHVVSLPGGNDSLSCQNEKFNIIIDNVNCILNSEMLLYTCQSLMKNLQTIEEMVLKFRMVSTCYKYQLSIAFYTLLQKV